MSDQQDPDEVMGVTGEVPPLLLCSEVKAVCQAVKTVEYAPFRQKKYLFIFSVVEPEEYATNHLQMFVRVNPAWKHPPIASKLFKAALVATDGQLRNRQRITKSMFIGKLFLCKLRTVGEGGARYSIIDCITERLAG